MRAQSQQNFEIARTGFGHGAEAYTRARPPYPAETIQHLVKALQIRPGAVVIELAAGNGLLTHHLLQTGATIISIEPSEGMRAEFKRRFPDAQLLEGRAEKIPLPDKCADAVVAGTAFHWFWNRPAFAEIARVLKSHGGVGSISNGWINKGFMAFLGGMVNSLDFTENASKEASKEVDEFLTKMFTPWKSFSHKVLHKVPLAGAVDLAFSSAMISSLPIEKHATIKQIIEQFLTVHPHTADQEMVELPFLSQALCCHKRF